MRTTRHQFHGKIRSRAPSKPCLIATFLFRFHAREALEVVEHTRPCWVGRALAAS